ncbi:tRNA (adenosine(37)-N6)-dimethylallyltransferase MiaA [Arenimonas sp. GDDSR-1]|uniref:tRNA (adenosine(37)-N6)-dimethylallyltransferase MiaA n=1 Tax=Arenimonas sp. GDDSR-1 TaxID=2950125 RepID=UPI0026199A70|nr:tRNA (adenosine(37)-N6)-dimethylallyltransferase MiaA [Arenimonas sp. GDDSR-1]
MTGLHQNAPGHDARPPVIAIMGPTASGKTAYAAELCRQLGTEIISVDSALVYRRLNIGAAKPDAATLAIAPHRMIDVRDPHEVFSAADFAREAMPHLQDLAGQGKVPLLVGGTGLYFRALTEGLSQMPAADDGVRAELKAQAASEGWQAMHDQLQALDPDSAARIHPNDPQRILRALEIHRLSGKSRTDWQRQADKPVFPFRLLSIVLSPKDRVELHRRIALRFDQMLADGFLDEVRALMADPRLHPDLPSMRSVGYRQAWQHLAGMTDAAAFREQAIAATRQLAKRQLTWFRGSASSRWFDPQAEKDTLDYCVREFLRPAQNQQ